MKWLLIVPGIALAALFGLVLLAVLVLLATRFSIRVHNLNGVFSLSFNAGPARFTLAPVRKRTPGGGKGGASKDKPPDKPPDEPEEPGQSASDAAPPASPAGKAKPSMPELGALLEYARVALDASGRAARRITFRRLRLCVVFATGDAATTAWAYGAGAAGVSALFPIFRDTFRVLDCDIALDADFDRGETALTYDVIVSAFGLPMVVAVLPPLFRLVRMFWRNRAAARNA